MSLRIGVDVDGVLADFRSAFRALARRGVAAIAIVADVDVAYGMSRMLSTRLDGLGLAAAVFRSSAEAEDWLDRRTS